MQRRIGATTTARSRALDCVSIGDGTTRDRVAVAVRPREHKRCEAADAVEGSANICARVCYQAKMPFAVLSALPITVSAYKMLSVALSDENKRLRSPTTTLRQATSLVR